MSEHTIPVSLPEGYVEFFKNLESWENEESIKLKNRYRPPSQVNFLKKLEEEKKPLILQVNPHIDADLYREVFSELLDFMSLKRPETASQLELIKNNLQQLDFTNIISSFIAMQAEEIAKAAEKANIPGELFFFLLDHAMRPFLRILAAPYQEELHSEHFYWDFSSTCPICGANRISVDCNLRTGNVSCSVIAAFRNGMSAISFVYTAVMIGPEISVT